jgi:DNA-binding transcriptional LysR family regulator
MPSAMRRGTFGDLAAFVAVADHLSFRAAAARLGVTPSALSHTMRELEARLGLRLLHRTTRSVSLTDAGRRLLERLRPPLDQIADALEDLGEEQQRPFGRLRVLATEFAAAAVIAPVWGRFLSTYSDVHLELSVGEAKQIDIVAKGFDCGITGRDYVPADMVAVRVTGPMEIAVVGAPTYFARRRPPRTPDDLARHSCVQYRIGDGATFDWPFKPGGKLRRVAVDGQVTVNDCNIALRAAIDGLGIAYIPDVVAAPYLRTGQLVRVLEGCSPAFEGFFLYYPGRRQVPSALRALIDMLKMASSPAKAARALENPFAAE